MDDVIMNEYLKKVEQNLKHLTVNEKTEIIDEIKNHIKEKQLHESVDMNTVLDSLGDPKLLGKAYGCKTVANTEQFNCKNFVRTLAYYSSTGFNGFFLSVLAGALYLSAFMVFLGGLIKTTGTIIGYDMSFVDFNIGVWQIPGTFALPVSIPVSLLIYFCSKKLWGVLKRYLTKKLEENR